MTVPGQIPPAYRRVGVPQGATVRVRAKRKAPPPRLTVEDADGTELLTVTITPDGLLDVQCDENRLTEAARQFITEVRWILIRGTGSTNPHISVSTQDTRKPREAGATDP